MLITEETGERWVVRRHLPFDCSVILKLLKNLKSINFLKVTSLLIKKM